MVTGEVPHISMKKAVLTPKAIVHERYGSNACYKIEEVLESGGSGCPGLVIPQHHKCLYRCCLELPEFSITSDTFTRKKDAEQSAAKLALEKLGIQLTKNKLTVQETWDELVARLSFLFTDQFLSSIHPLIGHFRAAFHREGDLCGLVPVSILATCDVKLKSLCKSISPKSELNPFLMIALLMKAAGMSGSISTSEGELWIWKQNLHSSDIIQTLRNQQSSSAESIDIEAIRIPCSVEKPVETLTLNVSSNEYYMDVIAQRLDVRDCSRVMISRPVGKVSSEMRLYFSAPENPLLVSGKSLEELSDVNGDANLEPLNARASYFSNQNIYGDAILATVGYTRKSEDLFHEDVSLSTYYRMLIGRMPNGNYKLSRDAILAAELPSAFTTRSNWRGSFPRDLLCMFCRRHGLLEPNFSTKEAGDANDEDSGGQGNVQCEIAVLSKEQDVIIKYSTENSFRKPNDAIQCAALKVLRWLSNELEMPMEKLSSFGDIHGIHVYPHHFSKEFSLCPSVHKVQQKSIFKKSISLGSVPVDWSNIRQENGVTSLSIEGPYSGVSPSTGSLTCISYVVSLMGEGGHRIETLETKDEFEFEIGTGAVIPQLEACITHMSVNQSARFIAEPPSKDFILAAAGESAKSLSFLSLQGCFLEYFVKVLQITEPLEDRMEQALFSPPLSKQRVEYALRHINESHATTLVDFGCGSGSLLDSLLELPTALEKIVGVDLSRKSLCRAAKILHPKLSMSSDPTAQGLGIRSAVLYDGSITDFDSRLYGFDIGTCLEVIEHMKEDEAWKFGDIVLSSFCPRILIVSTPNYEYNPVLQRTSLPNKEEDLEEKMNSEPFRFRNHDHKFEWTREQFNHWASSVALRHNYSVEFSGVGGTAGVEPGFASQIAVFRRNTPYQAESRNGDSSEGYEVIWEWSDIMSRCAL
ncbi:small RNA 2'-O-methyltransferase-like isoform X2 [Tasmannia lanceolata]|uniref:small RNA 2'-O-methyltransferase-like isoform X2 n=1 Tax=Tasmannia lanceolata TaxID=3420 RepID=UPI004063F43D